MKLQRNRETAPDYGATSAPGPRDGGLAPITSLHPAHWVGIGGLAVDNHQLVAGTSQPLAAEQSANMAHRQRQRASISPSLTADKETSLKTTSTGFPESNTAMAFTAPARSTGTAARIPACAAELRFALLRRPRLSRVWLPIDRS